MKKIVLPIVYFIIVVFLNNLYGILYQNFFQDLTFPERSIMLQTVSGIISFIAPVFLFYVFWPFRRTRPLLLAIPILSAVMTVLNITYIRSQFYATSLVSTSLMVLITFIALMVVGVWLLQGLLERQASLVKIALFTAGGLRFITFLIGNNITMRFVFRILDDVNVIQRYLILVRALSIIDMIGIVFVIVALYYEHETNQEMIDETDGFRNQSPSFSYDE